MGVLLWLRNKYRAESVELWFLGLAFVLVEAVALSIYRNSSSAHNVLHAVMLNAYLLAGVTFGWAARQDLLPGRRPVPYFLLPAVPLSFLTTLYGLEQRDSRWYLGTAVWSLLCGVVYVAVWASGGLWRRAGLLLIHFTMWAPIAWFAERMMLRSLVYWGLGCVYLLVAFTFRSRVRRGHIGGAVIVTGFAVWALCFLAHPLLRGHMPWDAMLTEVWNLQKFLVILGMILSLLEDETDRRRAEAMHDVLTGLPNRRLFEDRLRQALERCLRSGKSTALFVIDLDGFKAVNDTLGHGVGDDVLRRAAEALQANVRASDTLARCGGDEFSIVINDLQRRGDCERIAANLRAAVARVEVPNEGPALSASVGFAMFPEDAADSDELYRLADRRMYEEKHGPAELEEVAGLGRERVALAFERRAR